MDQRTALLIIDAQVNMFDPADPVSDAPALLERLKRLVSRFRASGRPVVFVRNCGKSGHADERGSPGWEIHPALEPDPGDLVVDKTAGDAFANTPLDPMLKELGVTRLVLAGLQSEYCVRDTTLGALSRGYEITLVSDGHSTCDRDGETAQEKRDGVNAEMQSRVTLLSTEEIRFP